MDRFKDEKLAELARAGDLAAEEELIRRYTRLVRAASRPFFLAGGDSEDLSQEGFLGLLAAVRDFDPGRDTAFSTFAELCVRRRLISAVKSAASDKHSPLNNSISINTSFFDDDTPLTDFLTGSTERRDTEEMVLDKVVANELLYDFKSHLSRLETRILALYLQGFSYAEIAREVNKPPKAVDNAVQRIRRKLTQLIETRRNQAKPDANIQSPEEG